MSDAVATAATPASQPAQQGDPAAAAQAGAQAQPNSGGAQKGDVSSAAAEAMRKYKVKVEGKELEVDEKELLRGYSHQRAASKELQEGKKLRQQNEMLLKMLKDPDQVEAVLAKLGHDPRKLYEGRLAKKLEDDLMGPRDKELRDTKARLKAIEEMEQKKKEQVEKHRLEQLKSKYMGEYESDFVKALEETKLPPTKPMVSEMAKYIGRAAQIGFKMTAAEAAQLVREDMTERLTRVIGDADGEALIKLIGENTVNKVRKWDTAKLRSPEAELRTPQNQNHEPRERAKKNKPMSERDWQLVKRGLK